MARYSEITPDVVKYISERLEELGLDTSYADSFCEYVLNIGYYFKKDGEFYDLYDSCDGLVRSCHFDALFDALRYNLLTYKDHTA